MTRRGAASVALGLALVVQGCAGLIAGKDSADAPPAAPAGPAGPIAGSVQVEKGRPGIVIAAPHGTSDSATDLMGRELAKLTGFSLVVVTGYTHVDAGGRRTEPARQVYQAYRRRVTEVAQGPLRLYVEVHGNARPESAGRMEIATVGVSRDDAWRLKALLEMINDARLPAEGDVPRLEVWMEPYDSLWYTASAAKQSGILAQTQLALHIELPRAARTTYREAYTTVLADFLIQSAALLLPPAR